MSPRLPILLAAVWALLAAPLAQNVALAAEPAFPTGMRIGLVPPSGLEPSRRFPGFEDSARKVSIAIFDLPGRTYEAIEQAAFSKAVKGLTVQKRELFSFADGLGFLVTGHAQVDGSSVYTYDLLINTFSRKVGQVGVFVRVHVPDAAHAVYPDAAIRAALHSVTFRLPPVAELLKDVPFKFGDMAGFRVMKVVPPTTAVLIDGPSNDPVKHPYMVVSVGRGAPAEAGARARFARDLLVTAPLRNVSITAMESMRIENLPGYEVRANAEGPDGAPAALVQWLRFGSTGYLRVIGVVAKDRWNELFTRFRAVRDGIDLR